MTTIAIFNQKGGVGKTSLCVNLSAALFRFHKKKVLVMDCDAQNNASEYLLRYGISLGKVPEKPHTIAEYLRGECGVQDMVYTACFKDGKKTVESSVDVILSGKDIDNVDFDSIDAYKDIIDQVSGDHDYCLIDCPPQRMPTALTSIRAADFILIPVWTENDSSFSGYTMANDLVNQFRDEGINDTLRILGLVVTKTKGSRVKLDQYALELCRQLFGELLFDTTIREAQVVNDAFMLRNPVVFLKKSAPVSKDYKALSDEFIRRVDEMSEKAGV